MNDLVYYGALAFLLCHELDAVHHKEWRLLFVLRRMSDERAFLWFTGLHAPLLVLLFWSIAEKGSIASTIQILIALFCMVHAGLHWRLRKKGRCPFRSPASRIWIDGSALLGGIFLILKFAPFST